MIEKLKPYFGAIVVGAVVAIGILGFQAFKNVDQEEVIPAPINNAKIILPDEINIEVGELGQLDATKSNGVSFVWKCLPEGLNVQVYENGKKLMFSSGRVGEYICVISSAYNDEVDQKVVKVSVHPIGYDPDNPNPPGPTPDVGTLAGKFQSWFALVRSPTKLSEAQALSEAFESVATQIEAGTADTAEAVQAATQTATQVALGSSIPQWTGFLNNLQAYLKTQKLRGTLVTVEDHVRVWKEIAVALKTIRN